MREFNLINVLQACVIAGLMFLFNGVSQNQDDILIIKENVQTIKKQMEQRGEKVIALDEFLRANQEWKLRHEFEGHDK